MLNNVSKVFYSVPTPVAGLALGIASLGIGLENSLPLHSLGQITGALISMALVILIVTKYILHPALIKEELKHPVLGSVMPTLAMALMLQSKSLSIINPVAAEFLWLFAVQVHLLLLAGFAFYRFRSFNLHHMVPSWFVPFVGICVAALTVPGPQHHGLAYGLLVFGMINYAVLLPAMVYRLIFFPKIEDPAKPTIAVMAAPASLTLVAYLTLEQAPSLLLCSILLGIAILMTSIVYLAFFKLLRLPFSPAFASYTFPMSVGAAALYKVADSLAIYPSTQMYSEQIRLLAVTELVIATLIIAYVCCRYLQYYVRAWAAVMQARKAVQQPVQIENKKRFNNCRLKSEKNLLCKTSHSI